MQQELQYYIKDNDQSCYNRLRHLEMTLSLMQSQKPTAVSPRNLMKCMSAEDINNLLAHIVLYFEIPQQIKENLLRLPLDTLRLIHMDKHYLSGSMKDFMVLLRETKGNTIVTSIETHLKPRLQEICPELYGTRPEQNLLVRNIFQSLLTPLSGDEIKDKNRRKQTPSSVICHTIAFQCPNNVILDLLMRFTGSSDGFPVTDQETILLMTGTEKEWHRLFASKFNNEDTQGTVQSMSDIIAPKTSFRVKRIT